MSSSRHRLLAGIIALASVAFVYFLPMVVAGKKGVSANTVGLMLGLVTVILLLVPTTVLTSIGWFWNVIVRRRRLGLIPIFVPLLVCIVSALPGMVHAHRAIFGWHSYLEHTGASFTLSAVNSFIFSNLSIVLRSRNQDDDSDHCVACLYWAIVVSSITNAAFPWWPLD